jgi:hypothetical protein
VVAGLPLPHLAIEYTKYRVGVLDEPYSQLIPLSRVAVQARRLHSLEQCLSCVSWQAGMATLLSWLSKVRLKLPLQNTPIM